MNTTASTIEIDITKAAGNLMEATANAHRSQLSLGKAQQQLAEKKAAILVDHAEDPKALGSNEATRNATLDAMCKPEIENVRVCQEGVDSFRLLLELARIEFDLQKQLVKLFAADKGL
jgi:hypothetical protein